MKLTYSLLVVCGVALLDARPARATVFFERIEATVYADAWGFEGSGPVQTTLFNSIYMDRWAQTSPTDYRDANASFTGGGHEVVAGPGEYPSRFDLINGSGYANKTHPDAIARSRVDLWFTAGFKSGSPFIDIVRDDAGEFTISCSGANSSVTIFYAGGSGVFASVSGGGSLSGRLSEVCSYHLVASVSGNGSYWFSVPSPGPLSLALLSALLCSRRRRAAQ